MAEQEKITEGKLLYDPLFAEKPILDWEDSKKGGVFGKSVVKKTLFIIILLASIAGALFFSFSSLSKERYEYEQLDNGAYKITAFHGQKNDTVLNIDFVRDDSGKADTAKPVAAVREYTVTGNDTLQFIYLGKSVSDIEKTAFYYCNSLKAIYVDEANKYFTSIDGVLYKQENGEPTEVVLCPQQHTKFMTAVALGLTPPANSEEAEKMAEKFLDEDYDRTLQAAVEDENSKAGKELVIPATVTKIGQLSFAYCEYMTDIKLPPRLEEIETMAFFKCSALNNIELPDTLEVIGSDAFSKCSSMDYLFIPASVKSIGHHAFWDCGKIEKVYMAAESTEGMELGETWCPQYRKTFMKNREIVFGAERGVK